MRGLQPQLRDLENQHVEDQAALDQAVTDLLREQDINPLTPWVRILLSALAFAILPVLLSPRRQNIPDLLAGVVVVGDSPARTN
jgi:membrane protein insertase Oxa1/YidC/SpoIIIJ